MRVDLYTKAVLTVIAACLVWLCVGGRLPSTTVSAQDRVSRVLVAGWVDAGGFEHKLNGYQIDGVPVRVVDVP